SMRNNNIYQYKNSNTSQYNQNKSAPIVIPQRQHILQQQQFQKQLHSQQHQQQQFYGSPKSGGFNYLDTVYENEHYSNSYPSQPRQNQQAEFRSEPVIYSSSHDQLPSSPSIKASYVNKNPRESINVNSFDMTDSLA